MNSLFWVGKYESDVAKISLFDGSITYYGSNEQGNYSFCNNKIRINSGLSTEFAEFARKKMSYIIAQNSKAKFLFYNQYLAYEIIAKDKLLETYILGLNSLSILNTLNNKTYSKLWLSNIVESIPFKVIAKNECNYEKLIKTFPEYDTFILQKNVSSGGKGTFLLSKDSEKVVYNELVTGELYIVSPYIKNAFSINTHICISDDMTIYTPISLQIIKMFEDKLLFWGSDYIEASNIHSEITEKIYNIVNKITEALKFFGYRGILGVDLLITKSKIYFVEINPRFQGSSMILNKALVENELPSLYELHIKAFSNDICSDIKEKIQNINVGYSCLQYKKLTEDIRYNHLYRRMLKNEMYNIYGDGYTENMPIDYNAYLFRVLLQTNISYVNNDNTVNVVENLLCNTNFNIPLKNTEDVISLKISLLTQGVIVSAEAAQYISETTSIKDATFNAIDVKILNDLKVNCPVNIPFSDITPFHIVYDKLNNLRLYYDEDYISDIAVDTNENLLERMTQSGMPYSSIGFKTNDRVRIRHTSVCDFKLNGQSCSFCESKHMKKMPFSDDDIFEVIDAYEKEVTFRHYLIGGASQKREVEPIRIKKIIQHIRKISSKPIYLMSLPPENLSHIYDYYQLGLNEIAFNLEIFDRKIASRIMPGKGKIPLEQYLNALTESVKYFGRTGNVRSMLIIGLEPENSLLKGVETLSSIGVSPMLSVFRPMPMTTMKQIVPPSVERLRYIFNKAENICEHYNVQLGPSCTQCQNNTLCLPTFYKELL